MHIFKNVRYINQRAKFFFGDSCKLSVCFLLATPIHQVQLPEIDTSSSNNAFPFSTQSSYQNLPITLDINTEYRTLKNTEISSALDPSKLG